MPSSLRYPFQKASRKCLLPLNLASGYRYPCSFPTLQNCFYIKAAPCGLLWVWSCRLRKVMSSQFCSQVLHSTLQRALCSLTFSVSAVISFFFSCCFFCGCLCTWDIWHIFETKNLSPAFCAPLEITLPPGP